jgi:hypothetical protein
MSEEIIEPTASPDPVGETAPEVEAAPEPSYEYVDTDAFSDKYVKVKVDGEEVSVPFNEAIQGYQRQADYTRKTQELSAQREQFQFASTLQQALENNPQQTIELLSRHYGVAEAQRMVADAQQQEPEVPQFDDPLEQRIWETEQRIQQYEQERANEQLQKEIGRLQSTYEDFDPQEVVRAALQRNTTDLEGVYKQIAYDKVITQLRAQQAAGQVTEQQVQAVVDAKRDAGFVSGGASAVAPTDVPTGSISSVADAWAAAKQQMGI